MSLSAVRLIANIASPDKTGLLDSFFSQRPASQGLYFRGDKNRVEFYPVSPADGSATMFWLPEVIDPSHLSLGIGDADKPAESGTFSLAYSGSSTALTGLSYAVDAATLQSALNANTAIAALPDTVAVSLLATGVYQVAFQAVGARSLLTGDPTGLLPECNVFVSRLQTGSATTKEIQIIQIVQRPYVYVSSWSATSGPSAAVTTIQTGTVSVAAMFEVEISPLPYAGSFTVAGSSPLAYNGTQDDWQTALGTGWNVVKTGEAQFTLSRTTVGVYAITSADINVSGLSVFSGLYGTLAFNAATLFKRFMSEPTGEFSTTLEVTYDDGTVRSVLLHVPVTLTKEILSAGSLSPSNWNGGFYTKTESDARFAPISATDIKLTVPNQSALLALTLADVQNGDFVLQSDTNVLYEVTDQSALGTAGAFTALATVTWDQVTGKPTSFAPVAHKSTHATGGSDALAPSDIGAVPTSRTINGVDLSANRTLNDIGAASVRLIKTTNFTADINGRYTVAGTATVTDPSGTTSGQIYSVVIGSGTATIGGVAYAPSRVEVIRYYNGSAWTTLSPTFSDNLTLNGTGNLAPNQTSASASSLMTRSLCDTRYQSTAPLFRKFNADIIYPIGLYAVTGGILTNGGNTIFNSGMRQIQATSTANSTALLIFPGIITNTSGNTDFSYGWTGFSVIMSLPYREGCTTRVGIGGVLTADTVMPVGSMNCRGMAIEFQMSSSVLQWRMITENDSGTENITSWAGIGALALFYEIAVFVNNATAYALVRPITADVSTVPTWTVNASLSGCTAGIVAGMVGCMVGVVNNGGAAGSCSAQIHALTFFHTQNDPR